MQLDGIDIALRPRSSWEAADLGIALSRRHYGTILKAWLCFGLPVFALLNGIAAWFDQVWFAAFMLWWLKPWFDRLVLHILSRAVFSASPSLRETLRGQWQLGPILAWLTWRRIDLTRSFTMPVAVLEGLSGRERSERFEVLGRANTSSVALGLNVVLAHFELALWLSIYVLALMFVPIEFLPESAQVLYETMIEDAPIWAQVLGNFIGFIAMTLVEPFFVGAGFALYLNRRTQLEAWDIELAFRRLADRLRQAVHVLVLLLPLGLLATAGDTQAARMSMRASELAAAAHSAAQEQETSTVEGGPEAAGDAALLDEEGDDAMDDAEAAVFGEIEAGSAEDESDSDDEDAAPAARIVEERSLEGVFGDRRADAAFSAEIKKTLQDDVFGKTEKLERWVLKNPPEASSEQGDAGAWKLWSRIFGFIAEFGLWILLAALVVFLLMRLGAWRLPMLAQRLRERGGRAVGVVADEVVEALPADVAAAAEALFARGAVREAMALLYRGACAFLPRRNGQGLPPGSTESDVVRAARSLDDPALSPSIINLVRAWQRTAYAADPPDAAHFHDLLAQYRASSQALGSA